MKCTYELDIIQNLGNERSLRLLGVRADADIAHLKENLNRVIEHVSYLNISLSEGGAYPVYDSWKSLPVWLQRAIDEKQKEISREVEENKQNW